MKTYKETKEAVKKLVISIGLNSILGYDVVKLYNEGHTATNVQNALSYFQYSPKAEKYRNTPSIQN